MSPLNSLLSRGKDAEADQVEEAAPATSVRPVVVRVNLLPPEIEEAAAFRRGQVVRGGVVAAAVALVAAGGFLTAQSVSSAQSDLDAEQATATRLAAEVQALAAVPRTQQQLSAAQGRLAGAMGQQVRWSTYLNALGMITPTDIEYTDVTVSQVVDVPTAAAGGAAATPPVTSAVGNPGIATVSFSGKAKKHTDVAALLNKLAGYGVNVDPYFSSATEGEDSATEQTLVTFTATTTVTDGALTHEFDEKGN